MAKDFIFPPTTRYTCVNCGRCCTHWAVKVEDETAEKIKGVDWASKYPELKDYDLFVRKKTGLTEGEAYFMRMKNDGRCPFLHDNNYCRIHMDVSYDAKPAGCKLFPLSMAEGPKGIHVRASYYCPAVAKNDGKALTAQSRWMSQCYRASGAQTVGDAVYLTEGIEIKWPELLLVESCLLKILKDKTRPFRERLLLGAALIEALMADIPGEDKSKIGAKARDLDKLGFEPLLDRIKAAPESPFRGRLALSLFMLQDTKPTTVSRLLRIPSIVLFLLKIGGVKSNLLGVSASLGKTKKIGFGRSDESDELFERFFEQKIVGKRYIEGDLTVESGWALMCSAYALIELLSRSRAAKQKRDKVAHDDLIAAAGVADLLAVEHTVFFQMDTTRKLVNIVLSQPGMSANVLGAI